MDSEPKALWRLNLTLSFVARPATRRMSKSSAPGIALQHRAIRADDVGSGVQIGNITPI